MTQSFYAGFFIWPLSRAAPMTRKFFSPQWASKVEPTRSASSFNSSNFLRNTQNPPRASGTWRHPHFVTLFPISAYCDISEYHVRPAHARVNTCINVLSRKVLSLTKPKGMNRNPTAIILHRLRICEFYPQSRYYVQFWINTFWRDMNLPYLSLTVG